MDQTHSTSGKSLPLSTTRRIAQSVLDRSISWLCRGGALSATLAAAFLAGSSAEAANGTWVGNGADGLWSTPENWTPGTPGGTTPSAANQDTALFNSNPARLTVGIDADRNIKIINFDTDAGAFVIGDAGPNAGNPLYLSANGSLGSIKILPTFLGTGITQTINAPILLQPNAVNGAETLSFANDAAAASNVLKVAGSIAAVGTTGVGTLNLTGANTGDNLISAPIDGTGASAFSVNKSGAGTWNLAGSITTKGVGANGGMTISGGTLNFADTSTANIAGKVVVTNGATVNSAGTVALGTNLGGTPGDYITIGDGSNGTLNVTGGTFTITPSTGKAFVIGTTTSGITGTVNVSGGTLQVTNNGPIRFGSFDGTTTHEGKGILTISGTGFFDTGLTTGAFAMGNGSAASSGTINLDGGTFQTRRSITKGAGSAAINFNGGTLKAATTSTTLISASVNSFVKAGGAIIDTNGFNLTIDSAFQADAVSLGGGLTKKSNGNLTLNGVNTYTGPTNIEAGLLALGASGSISGSSQINVASGATFGVNAVSGGFTVSPNQRLLANGTVTGAIGVSGVLGGSGTVNGAVTIHSGGTLAPGNSPGTLDINGPLSFAGSSVLSLEITGNLPGHGAGFYDQVNMTNVGGAISIDSGAQIILSLSAFNPQASDTFFVLTRADLGTFSSFFANAGEGATINLGSGYTGTITYMADFATSAISGGNDVAVYNVVPEPGSAIALLVSQGTLLGLLRLRRRRS